MNINYTHICLLLINMLLMRHLVLGNEIETGSKEKNDITEQLSPANQYCPGVFSFAGSTKTESDCNTVANGAITINVSGGMPPYTFKWKDGPTTQNRTDLLMGDYTVTVIDSAGCMADTSFHLNRPYNIYFDNTQNVCPNETNGVINIYYATSCMCSYSHCTTEFTRNGEAVGTIVNTSQSAVRGTMLENLVSGVYHYKFTSTYGCVIYDSVTISPDPFYVAIQQTGESMPGAHDATAKAIVSGGTGPYTYQWNDPAHQTTQTATGLSANNSYTVTIKDSENCETSSLVTVHGTSVTGLNSTSYDMTGVKVYPNPGIQEVTLEVEKNQISLYSLILHDATGKTVREYADITDERLTISQEDLSPGLYQATLIHPNGKKSFKIMFSK